VSERIRTVVALVVIAASLALMVAVLATDSAGSSDRVHSLAERLKCPICTSESIADSPSQVSRDLYDLITDQVADGWTDDEVFAFFVATYGEETLLDPKTGGAGAFLWIAPFAAVALGAVVIAKRLAGEPNEVSEEERDRIAAALEERS